METHSNDSRNPKEHEKYYLTIAQIKQLLKVTSEPALKAFLTIALTTGMRRGELLGLRWQDIDEQNETVHIHRLVSGNEEREAKETARTIALPTIALRTLKEHQQSQQQERGETWQNDGLVFADASGQHSHSGKLSQHSHAIFVAIGLSHLRFHDLRYSAVANFIAMGVNVAVIHAIVGVRYPNTVLKTLTPVSLSMQKEAMKKWDGLLAP